MPTKNASRIRRKSPSKARRPAKREKVITGQYYDTRGFTGGTPQDRLRAALEFVEHAERDAPGRDFPILHVNVPPVVYVDMGAWPEGRAFSPATMRFLRSLDMQD